MKLVYGSKRNSRKNGRRACAALLLAGIVLFFITCFLSVATDKLVSKKTIEKIGNIEIREVNTSPIQYFGECGLPIRLADMTSADFEKYSQTRVYLVVIDNVNDYKKVEKYDRKYEDEDTTEATAHEGKYYVRILTNHPERAKRIFQEKGLLDYLFGMFSEAETNVSASSI